MLGSQLDSRGNELPGVVDRVVYMGPMLQVLIEVEGIGSIQAVVPNQGRISPPPRRRRLGRHAGGGVAGPGSEGELTAAECRADAGLDVQPPQRRHRRVGLALAAAVTAHDQAGDGHRGQREGQHQGGQRVQRRRRAPAAPLSTDAPGSSPMMLPPTRNWLMTKSSIEIANTMAKEEKMAGASNGRSTLRSACTGRRPEVHGRLFVVPPDREQPSPDDYHHERDREGHVSEKLSPGPERNEVIEVGEHQEQRYSHDDLGGHQGNEHQGVGCPGRPGPATWLDPGPAPPPTGWRPAW